MKDVVRVYVSEYELEDLTIEELEHSCGNTWNPQSISDMLEDMNYFVFKMAINDDETINVYVDIEDSDELAEWCLENGLKEYDEKHTVRESEEDYDMFYKGTKFKFIVLVEDILTDFMSDAVGDIKSITELSKGVSVHLE